MSKKGKKGGPISLLMSLDEGRVFDPEAGKFVTASAAMAAKPSDAAPKFGPVQTTGRAATTVTASESSKAPASLPAQAPTKASGRSDSQKGDLRSSADAEAKTAPEHAHGRSSARGGRNSINDDDGDGDYASGSGSGGRANAGADADAGAAPPVPDPDAHIVFEVDQMTAKALALERAFARRSGDAATAGRGTRLLLPASAPWRALMMTQLS